jgi:hypothetical protein
MEGADTERGRSIIRVAREQRSTLVSTRSTLVAIEVVPTVEL